MDQCKDQSRLVQCSFKFDRLVDTRFVEGGPPDLVRCLMLTAAETERGSDAEIEIVHGFEIFDELLRVDLRSRPFQGFYQQSRGDEAFERCVVRRFADK